MSNPNPTLFLGHSVPSLGKKERRKIKNHDQPISKKRKILCTEQEECSASDKEAASMPQMQTDEASETLSRQSFDEEMSYTETHTYSNESNENAQTSVLSDSDDTCLGKN